MSLRTLNRYYAPLTLKIGSDKLLWKAHVNIKGIKIEYYYRPFSLDSYIKREIFNMNAYKIIDEIYKDGTVLDIGAHIGLYSLLAKRFAKEVIAFEPDERNRRIFRLNQSINNFPEIILQPFTIDGTQNPETKMFFYSNAGNNSCVPYPYNGKNMKMVPNVDINSYLPIDILKIDIEGAEYDVIDSIQDLSKVNRALTIEVHYHVPEWKSRLHNMIKKLNDNGFKVEWVKKYSYNGHIYAKRIN